MHRDGRQQINGLPPATSFRLPLLDNKTGAWKLIFSFVYQVTQPDVIENQGYPPMTRHADGRVAIESKTKYER